MPKYSPTIISPKAQDLILEAIPEPARGAFYAAVDLLLRPGEIRALNVEDYDPRQRALTVAYAMKGPNRSAPRRGTKEDDVRRREVSDRLAAWLQPYVSPADRLQGGAPLFRNPTGRGDKRWLSNALRLGWNRAAASVALDRVKMYEGTKHSTATALRRAGVPLDVIQAAAGHKDVRSTQRYAQLADQAVVDALRKRTAS